HLIDERVLGIQHRKALLRNRSRNDRFNAREVVERVYIFHSEVIGRNVQDHADVAMIEPKARTNDAAAGSFENADLNRRVLEDKLGGDRAGIVACYDLLIADISSVRCGEPDVAAAVL